MYIKKIGDMFHHMKIVLGKQEIIETFYSYEAAKTVFDRKLHNTLKNRRNHRNDTKRR